MNPQLLHPEIGPTPPMIIVEDNDSLATVEALDTCSRALEPKTLAATTSLVRSLRRFDHRRASR